MLFVRRFTDSGNHFGIFKLFFYRIIRSSGKVEFVFYRINRPSGKVEFFFYRINRPSGKVEFFFYRIIRSSGKVEFFFYRIIRSSGKVEFMFESFTVSIMNCVVKSRLFHVNDFSPDVLTCVSIQESLLEKELFVHSEQLSSQPFLVGFVLLRFTDLLLLPALDYINILKWDQSCKCVKYFFF